MSVLNIAFHADHILLLSDTLTYCDGAPVGLCDRKIDVGVSGRYAFGSRGSTHLGRILDNVMDAETADDAFNLAQAFAAVLPSHVLDQYLGRGFEITVAGWSDREDDPAVRQVTIGPDRTIATRSIPRGVHLSPTSPTAPPPLPATVTEAQFVRLALAQHRIQDRLEAAGLGRMCVGGAMHMTRVDRFGATQRIAGVYPDYAEHAARFGCPIADEVAEFLAAPEAVAA